MSNLSQKIEALLFYKNEPTTFKELKGVLGVGEEEIKNAITKLKEELQGRGVRIMEKDDEVMLGTAPEFGEMIEQLIKQELNKDLGKAGLETLAAVLYLGPIAKNRVDYIRGVNSGFILRNLMIRGLVERVSNPGDQRSFLYKPTFELLSYLGITEIAELPNYTEVVAEISAFENQESLDGEE